MAIQTYRDLDARKIGMELVVGIYTITKAFPPEERYGLRSQLRRAAVSIPSNIAEGHQMGTKSYAHFVSLALGSLAEVETQLEVATRLRYVGTESESIAEQVTRLRCVLHGLRRSLIAHR